LLKLLQRFELRLAAIAAAALLIAQLGAMAHAYTHVPQARLPAAHQSTPATQESCDDCLNFAPLLSAAGAPAGLPFVAPQGRGIALQVEVASLIDVGPRLAFRSRAPPVTR
jgi:hypothetical protein